MVEETKAVQKVSAAIDALKAEKPGDRSEMDRYHAIAITELEKVLAYIIWFKGGSKRD